MADVQTGVMILKPICHTVYNFPGNRKQGRGFLGAKLSKQILGDTAEVWQHRAVAFPTEGA
jgi:hypothetical protein